MANAREPTPAGGTGSVDQFDAIIIGAGVSGLYQLHRLRQLGLGVRVYEDGGGVGGTWYWNRSPGARFDSESYTYGYSLSEELLQEWDWKEHFSGQPETERYLNYVADKFDLRRDIQLNTRVVSATFEEAENRWEIRTRDGGRARARFLITAVGSLSAHYVPNFPGIESFKGESYHATRWPHENPHFSGKRVGVIGTGATAVQLITEIAKEVGHLTVFQRTPNYCAPLRNGLIDPETQKKIKACYPEIFRRTRETTGAFIHNFDPRSVFEVSPEERHARFEELWAQPGFAKWLGNFRDIMTNREANELFAKFVRNKIRERVKDPVVAEKLVPRATRNDRHFCGNGEPYRRALRAREGEFGLLLHPGQGFIREDRSPGRAAFHQPPQMRGSPEFCTLQGRQEQTRHALHHLLNDIALLDL
jgi:cation diffusion facilitator CzcD-associated flavoprotein CzcO